MKNLGMEQNYNRLSGQALFTPAGETGAIDLGNITLYKFEHNIETKDHYVSRGGMKQLDRSDVTQVSPKFTVEGDEYHQGVIPILLFGEQLKDTEQTAGTAQTLTITSPVIGRTYILGKEMLSNVSVKSGSVDKVEGTDYALDAELGAIRILDGGSIKETDDLQVKFDCGTITRATYVAMTKLKRSGVMRIVERDGYSATPLRITTFPCNLSAENFGENNGDDFAKFSIVCSVTGRMEMQERTTIN